MVTATIVPFGFVVLATAILGHLLVKRRQERAAAERVNTRRPHWLASLGPDQWAISISTGPGDPCPCTGTCAGPRALP